MSLLDSGPHTVVVTPAVRRRDSMGGYVYDYPSAGAVTVPRVAVQPVSTAEQMLAQELAAPTTLVVIGRGPWPGGPHSRVTWNGRDYEQNGDAKIFSMSPATGHFEVFITREQSEVR